MLCEKEEEKKRLSNFKDRSTKFCVSNHIALLQQVSTICIPNTQSLTLTHTHTLWKRERKRDRRSVNSFSIFKKSERTSDEQKKNAELIKSFKRPGKNITNQKFMKFNR